VPRFEWYGDNESERMIRAVKRAIDHTLVDCVAHAQLPYPTGARRDTSTMANKIEFERAQEMSDGRIVGRWGNLDGPEYALVWEMRDKHLRRAADVLYPTLDDRIEEEFELG
jgi:hypothetical protein